MIPHRVAATSARRLSRLLQNHCRISSNVGDHRQRVADGQGALHSWSHVKSRLLSTTGGGGDDKNSNSNSSSGDPFGVQFEDGADKVGPNLPPKYRRDATTGKFTGDVEAELTSEERDILGMDPLERDKHLLKRLVQSWDKEESQVDPKTGDPKAMADFARRVRLAKMSLNVLGRTVQAQAAKSILEDGEEFGRDPETGFTQSLTKSEFETFQKYMRDQHGKEITEEDVPVHPDDKAGMRKAASARRPSPLEDEDIAVQGITDDASVDADNPDLSLKWLTSRAQWEVNRKYGEDGPFDEMMPRDLTMTRIVNRKRAKILPRELLHHNNLSLLRRYISPAGQIMHRVRTRLGARDQRKIAKLVKRARNLGLIPHTGQFVVEDNGNIHEKDIRRNRPWEEELIRRGLVISKKQEKGEGKSGVF